MHTSKQALVKSLLEISPIPLVTAVFNSCRGAASSTEPMIPNTEFTIQGRQQKYEPWTLAPTEFIGQPN